MPQGERLLFAFDTDTAVTPDPDKPGRWHGTMTDRWDIGDKPNGGYVIACATQAIAAALPDHPDPFTTTAHYLRPGEPGPFTVDVDVVRTGRKLATATATLRQFGKEKIAVIATFGDLDQATGPTVVAGTPPELPDPETCVSRRDAMIRDASGELSRFTFRTDTLLHPDAGWLRGTPSGVAHVEAWSRFSDGREPDPLALLLFADALPPAVFEVLHESMWVPTIELTVHVRAKPAPGWLRISMTTRFLQDGYFEEDGEIWDSTGRLVAQSRQLAMLFRP